MTFLEKLKEDNPHMSEGEVKNLALDGLCPVDCGYEGWELTGFECDSSKCEECWNREMPNTEATEEPFIDFKGELDMAYNKGLNDAWELLSKLYDFTCDELLDIFDLKNGFYDVIRNYTPQEALAKLKAYEEAQNKIEVGDVIKTPVGNAVVTYVREDEYIAITSSGAYVRLEGLVAKTGKHIDIQSILEQIKGK